MAKYSVTIKPSALAELAKVPKKIAKQFVKRIGALAVSPRPVGCMKLSGQERYRVRQGDYRIVYGINDQSKTIDVVKIGHRREIYR